MSTSDAASPTAAPWRARFLADLQKMDQPSFTLASLHAARAGAAAPRARTCIFRGLWAALPPSARNPAPRNPPLFESDLPVLTTDARMHKVPDLLLGGGGGGPVEAVWWAVATQTQWRVRGRAWVLAPGDGGREGAGPAAARAAVRARMRRSGGAGAEADWDWEREVVAHFGNLGPGMRGSFKNPPPGTPRAARPGQGEGLGQQVGDELLGDEVAKRNFRVVVIVPEEVELVDLGDPADQRRWSYTFVGAGAKVTKPGAVIEGEWEKVELWP